MRPSNFDAVGELVKTLSEGGGRMFEAAPALLQVILEERLWEQRLDKSGKPFASFEAFVTHRFWHGLESSVDDLLRFCRRYPDVQRMILAEVGAAADVGRPGAASNVSSGNINGGNRTTYTLRRLKRDNPELAARVVAGEISANAAAVQAGFRRATWTAPAEPGELARAIHKRFSEEFAKALKESL